MKPRGELVIGLVVVFILGARAFDLYQRDYCSVPTPWNLHTWQHEPSQPHFPQFYAGGSDTAHCVNLSEVVPPLQSWTDVVLIGNGCWTDGSRALKMYSVKFDDGGAVTVNSTWTLNGGDR